MSVEDKTSSKNDVKESDMSPVFSDEEIRTTVKGFILAFIRKEVTVDLHAGLIAELTIAYTSDVTDLGKEKTPEELLLDSKARAKIMSEIQGDFLNLIEICSGAKQATTVELKESFNKLFKEILTLRLTKKMEGSFWDYSLEYRLEKLEKKVDTTIELLRKEVRWLKEQEGV